MGEEVMAVRLFKALMTVTVLTAFVSATSASAAPVVTYPTGTVLGVGSKLVGTNLGEIVFGTSFGNVTCNKATITGTLVTNSTAAGSKAEITSASFTGSGAGGECTTWTGGTTVNANPATNGLPWCVEETGANDEGKKRGGGCGSLARPIRFALVFTSIGTCTYQRASAAVSIIRTDTEGGGSATITLSEQEWARFEGGFACPSSGKISLTYAVETDGATPEPVYLSS
jgi:hypothetical protein